MSRRVVLTAAILYLTSTSCSRSQSDAQEGVRARRAEIEFAQFGAADYHVITFSADPERSLTFRDDYEQQTRVFEVPFVARVRFTAPFVVLAADALNASVGTPGWSVATMEHGVQALQVFGAVSYGRGDEIDIEGAVMFDHLESGWRFRCLDRIR